MTLSGFFVGLGARSITTERVIYCLVGYGRYADASG